MKLKICHHNFMKRVILDCLKMNLKITVHFSQNVEYILVSVIMKRKIRKRNVTSEPTWQPNIQNALKVQVTTVHRSMQNPLIRSIHQSIGVIMNKFLELVAEEIESSANETLKDIQNKKRRPARPSPTACSKCIGAFQITKWLPWTGLFRSLGLFQSDTNFISDCRQITFVTLNGFCPLSKPHTSPPPPPPPPPPHHHVFLNEQYQNG